MRCLWWELLFALLQFWDMKRLILHLPAVCLQPFPFCRAVTTKRKDKNTIVNYALQASDICFIIENIHRSFHIAMAFLTSGM